MPGLVNQIPTGRKNQIYLKTRARQPEGAFGSLPRESSAGQAQVRGGSGDLDESSGARRWWRHNAVTCASSMPRWRPVEARQPSRRPRRRHGACAPACPRRAPPASMPVQALRDRTTQALCRRTARRALWLRYLRLLGGPQNRPQQDQRRREGARTAINVSAAQPPPAPNAASAEEWTRKSTFGAETKDAVWLMTARAHAHPVNPVSREARATGPAIIRTARCAGAGYAEPALGRASAGPRARQGWKRGRVRGY